MSESYRPTPREASAVYLAGDCECDARALVDVQPLSRPSGRLGPRCMERAWVATVVVGTTYDDDGEPSESELARRYACLRHLREALEWAWQYACDSVDGSVVVEEHEHILRSDLAVMPPERWSEPYVAGLPDDPDWRP